MSISLGLDIGSNSVGSAWIDSQTGQIVVGLSVFPAGVDESDEKRGEPKNAKRRTTRRSRITLARRAERKRRLRLKLISVGLLPADAKEFKKLLEDTDPWALRRQGLTQPLSRDKFGRVLLHLAQRRGALGFDAEVGDKGTVKGAIVHVQLEMLDRFGSDEGKRCGRQLRETITALGKKKRSEQEDTDLENAQEELKKLCKSLLLDPAVTYGRFIADLRDERCTPITSEDRRKQKRGPRQWRKPVRNKAGNFEFHADRAMIQNEFAKLWDAQKRLGGPLSEILTDDLRRELDDETRDSVWRHRGLLFGQRMQSWDLGTLGRCVLEPTERCAPHADMYASRYLVVETVNNLKIIERGREARSLTPEERTKIKNFLSGPLGVEAKGKRKGQPKRSVTVSDLRELMGWGPARKTSQFRFNIESDEERQINTDWFAREIVHGAVTPEKWDKLSEQAREGINRAILKHDPDDDKQAEKLKKLVMAEWAGLTAEQADALVAAWKKRPRPDAKRLNMSRRAVRNLLTLMDRAEPWLDPNRPGQTRWLTQIEARKLIAEDADFLDVTTKKPLDEHTRRRYATGAKGATARDRHYMGKHLLKKKGQPVYGPDGLSLHEPPPAPLISNPVVRKAIHEVRRHVVEFLTTLGRKPERIGIELAREAKMGKVDADRLLFKNRLRNRIRNEIIHDPALKLADLKPSQQRAAVERVILWAQQKGECPLCGDGGLTAPNAAAGIGCELAHIIPSGSGGHNGLSNIVLAHTKCNRDMARRTPRQFWEQALQGGFEEGLSRVERHYGDIERPKFSEVKETTGIPLWTCYFTKRDDLAKIEQFKKDITNIQGMTERQLAATKYAARQVMAYLADALFDGKGLPERGGARLIFATDGLWTSRLRREWGLFFDPHHVKAKGLTGEEQHKRKEKDRGDHRHHAIDAIVIALCTREVQIAWETREKQAEAEKVNTADTEQMDNYRRDHPLPVPAPFKDRDAFREAVRLAVFVDPKSPGERAVCHRPVKRKLIGALHEETLFGPALDRRGRLTDSYTAKKSVLGLDPNHLRLPKPESRKDALQRLSEQFKAQGLKPKLAKQRAEQIVNDPAYKPTLIEPPPGKPGIVRDPALRRRLRDCLSGFRYIKKNKSGEPTGESWFINPDAFSDNELKQAVDAGAICQASGVPIRSVVLLRTMTDPVLASRWAIDYQTGKRYRLYDVTTGVGDPAAARAYVGGNNHHIEIRVDAKGKWSGQMVTAFEAAQQKLARLRAMREAGIPKPRVLRMLPAAERVKLGPALGAIDKAHPLVDRSDSLEKGGKFIMSLCEGEILKMRCKTKEGEPPGDVGYFVVAKLDKPQSIVVVPHWDARAATERKDPEGKKVEDSKRDQFAVTPTDLKTLAPPGEPHARKVRVSPLGEIRQIND